MLRTPGAASELECARPAHTPDHVDCPGCRARSIADGKVLLPEMPFAEAFARWMKLRIGLTEASAGRAKRWGAETIDTYGRYGDAFSLMFGRVPLIEISDGHLCEFAETRLAGGAPFTKPCGGNRVRKETDTVVRVLRDAHLWTPRLDRAYKLLRLPMEETDDQRALTREEIGKLVAAAARSTEESRWVLYYIVVALHTCASTSELRYARLCDVDLVRRTFRVGPRAAKNKYRNRTIPLETEEVLAAMEWLVRRAARCGAAGPDDFLFPRRMCRTRYDPGKPMTRWCLPQQFEGLTEAARLPKGTRPYDLRHTAMSILAEAGTPISTIMAFGGQVSRKMHQHYTTISMLAKREAQPIAFGNLRLLPEAPPPRIPPSRVVTMPTRTQQSA